MIQPFFPTILITSWIQRVIPISWLHLLWKGTKMPRYACIKYRVQRKSAGHRLST